MAVNPFILGCGVVIVIGGATLATTWALQNSGADCGAGNVAGGNIGGPFELMNSSGALVSDTDAITGPTLVYFGYTYCPDFCPVDVSRNALAIELLEEQGHLVDGLFITVDPARDTADVVGDYAANFHERMVGLTGTPEQIEQVSQVYRLRVQLPEDTSNPDYLVGHTTFTYLMAPEVGFIDFFRSDTSAEDMAAAVACFIG